MSPEYLAIPCKHYACRVLRREVQVPLRKVLELPEVYMSAYKWDELPYARVASTAMRQYKEASWMCFFLLVMHCSLASFFAFLMSFAYAAASAIDGMCFLLLG